MEENNESITITNAPTAPGTKGPGADESVTDNSITDQTKGSKCTAGACDRCCTCCGKLWCNRWILPLRNIVSSMPSDHDARSLENAIAKAAGDGQDMEIAAKALDEAVKARRDNTELPTAVVATVLSELHYGPIRKAFSESLWPCFLTVYEIVVLLVWLKILGHDSRQTEIFLSGSTWNLPDLLKASTVAGSIGAISLALYGIYTHTKYRSMDHGFIIWYLIRPVSGGLMGAFIGLISRIVLTGISAQGMMANIVILCITFLAGSNEKFAAYMIDRFTSQIFGNKPPSSKAPAVENKP